MPSATPEVLPEPSSTGLELSRVLATPALRRSCIVIAVVGVLAPLANVATLTSHDSPRTTANAFTSINAGVLLALLLGVLGTTGSARLRPGRGARYHQAVGAKARAYGIVGAGSVLVLAALAAAIGLPIMHARGVVSPASSVVAAYIQRETVAGARLAILGVAIGLIAKGRGRAIIALISFLVIEAITEAYVPFIKTYGPIGALNAFSDPSHHHQLSVGAGAAIAFAWAILALLAATLITEHRHAQTVHVGNPSATPPSEHAAEKAAAPQPVRTPTAERSGASNVRPSVTENVRPAQRGARRPPRKDDDFLTTLGRAMGIPPARKPRDNDHST